MHAQLAHEVGGRVLGHHVGDKALVAGTVLARQHHGIAHRRVVRDGGFDLAQLDAMAADLDLSVAPPDEFDGPVGAIAPNLPCDTGALRLLR